MGDGPARAAQHAEKPMERGEIPKLVEAALQRREEELTRVETEKRVETLWRSQAAREENDRIADLIQQYQARCVSLEFEEQKGGMEGNPPGRTAA